MTQPSRTRSQVDPYGFQHPDDFDYKTYEEFMASYLSVLARRASRWSGLMQGRSSVAKSRQLKRFVRKGVPAEFRTMVWMCVSGAQERMEANPGLFHKLLQEDHDEELVETIKTDIHRTFPDNIYFQDTPSDPNAKRRPLYRVLLALAHKNSRVGYCQGLNFIVGMLLLIAKDEEKVFWLMDTLLNHILPDYYGKDMVEIKTDQEVLGELVRSRDPEVAAFLEQHGVVWSLVCTKWFICLFADVMPVETLLRIWDAMFYEGDKILMRIGVTLVQRNRQAILACKGFPEIVTVFKQMTTNAMVTHCHEFMQSIFKVPGSFPRATIQQLRQQCREKVLAEG